MSQDILNSDAMRVAALLGGFNVVLKTKPKNEPITPRMLNRWVNNIIGSSAGDIPRLGALAYLCKYKGAEVSTIGLNDADQWLVAQFILNKEHIMAIFPDLPTKSEGH